MASILIADDDLELSGLIQRALETAGHDVMSVANGSEAFEALQANPAKFALVLSDVQMPGLDGVALAEKARNSFPGVKFVLMTGDAHERERTMVENGQVAGLLEKPFTLDTVRDRIAELI